MTARNLTWQDAVEVLRAFMHDCEEERNFTAYFAAGRSMQAILEDYDTADKRYTVSHN